MARFGNTFSCPLCSKEIEPPNVKRHLKSHDTTDKATADIAWVRWLERIEEISAENADAMVGIIERCRVTLPAAGGGSGG